MRPSGARGPNRVGNPARANPKGETGGSGLRTMTTGPVLLALGVVVAAAAASARFPPLHPSQLWLLPWAGALTLFALHLLPYQDLSGATIALIACSAAAFCGGALAGDWALRKAFARRSASPGPTAELSVAAALTVAATAVGVVLFLAQIAASFGLRAALVTSADVRIALSTGTASLTIKYIYFAFAGAALTGLAAGQARTARERFAWTVAALFCVGSQYFSTGRSNVLLAGVAGATAYVLALRPSLSKVKLGLAIALVSLLTLPLFLGMGALLGKTYAASEISTFRNFFNEHPSVEQFATPYQYVSAPIPSLNEVVAVTDTWGRADGCASFQVVCSTLSRLGLGVVPEPKLSAFTGEPSSWNTFTALYAPLVDFGPYLAVLVLALEGAAVGLVWGWACTRRPEGIACYACLSPAVAYSIVENSLLAPHLIGAGLIAFSAVLVARWLVQARFLNSYLRAWTSLGRNGSR